MDKALRSGEYLIKVLGTREGKPDLYRLEAGFTTIDFNDYTFAFSNDRGWGIHFDIGSDHYGDNKTVVAIYGLDQHTTEKFDVAVAMAVDLFFDQNGIYPF